MSYNFCMGESHRDYHYAIIGDVVRSRLEDQEAMFETLTRAMDWVNGEIELLEDIKLAPAAGDEIQGVSAHIAAALKCTLYVQLKLKGKYELRFGIGYGTTESYELAEPAVGRSGTAWWNARDAIDALSELQKKKKGLPKAAIRTRLSLGEHGDFGTESLANGLLLFRDQIVQGMSQKDAMIALRLFAGQRQIDIAEELDVSQSRVSDVSRNKGAAVLIICQQMLEEGTRRMSGPRTTESRGGGP